MKILIVDDNRDDRKVLRYMIERNGHKAIEAEDGFDGLKKAKASPPDLIISDALMPVMDGFQFLKGVKQEPNLRSIPFIFYSSSYKEYQDVRLAMSLGADAYVFKPVDPVELWGKIEGILREGKKEKTPPVPLIEEDAEYLKRYSEVVATKLEEKVQELERTLEDRKSAEEELRQMNERFSLATNAARLGVWDWDIQKNELIWDHMMYELYGIKREDFAGAYEAWLKGVHPDDRARSDELSKLAQRGEREYDTDFRVVWPDGSIHYLKAYAQIVRDAEGRPLRMTGINFDITERKRAEQERLANLKFFESMDKVNRAMHAKNDLEQMMSDVLDVLLSIFDCDRAFLLYPCDPEAVSWSVPMERTRPEYPGVLTLGIEIPMDPNVAASFKTLLSASGPVKFGPGYEHPLPEEVSQRFGFKSFMSMALYPKLGKPWQFGLHQCSYARVWTRDEEKLFQEIGRRLSDGLTGMLTYRNLRENELKYRRIVDTASEGVWMVGRDMLTTFVNARMADMLGYQVEEMIGRPLTEFMFDEDADDHHRRMDDRRLGRADYYERRFRRKDGQTVWTLASAVPIFDAGNKFNGSFAMFTDITERKRSEDALKKSEAFVKDILETVDEGFIVVDRQYRIMSANKAFCNSAKMSMEQVLGQPCYMVSHHIDKPCFEAGEECAVKPTFETGMPSQASHMHVNALGSKQYVEIKAYPISDAAGNVVSAIETITDVTEKKKLEEQLRQAQKMEAIGTLAGGVAHDFNNILTAIIGYGHIAKMKLKPNDPQQALLDQILQSADRAAHLTQGLLAFSRKQIIKPRPLDLNEVIESIEKLLRRLIGEDIDLSAALAANSLMVMADASQLEQVLMNLAANARDAMPYGGSLAISTQKMEITDDFINAHAFGKPGKYALITVSDTGIGMDTQTREKIFEPFFTTKELGKGTGLGLAIVYGIIRQHDGYINVYSEPGKGTTFKIYLPMIVIKTTDAVTEAPARAAGGNETILLAEDDATVRQLTKDVLLEVGYRVIEAVDGEDALQKFKQHAGSVDLLLLDVVMPHKSGKEVYDAIRSVQPDVVALFISGYTADIIHKKGVFEEGLEFISKPVSPFDLMRKLREILNKRKRED